MSPETTVPTADEEFVEVFEAVEAGGVLLGRLDVSVG